VDEPVVAAEPLAETEPAAAPEPALDRVASPDRVVEAARAIELVIEPLPIADSVPADVGRAVPEPIAVVSRPRSHGTPLSKGGPVSAPLMGQPPPAVGDVLDAEIVDEPPPMAPSRTTVSAAAAEVLSVLTEVAFREARTDEWIMDRPELLAEPSTGALATLRPGPTTLRADSWETDDLPVPQHEAYQGRRRAASSAKLWLVIGLVITALGTAIAVPFLLTSGNAEPVTARTPTSSAPGDQGAITVTPSSGAESSAAGAVLPVIGASPLVTPSATPSSTPAPFAPMTIEAEAGGALTKWSESTAVKSALAGASGGFVIDRIGEWGSPDGYLEVTVTVPEAGTYRLAVSYLFLASNFESTRRARITITYPAGASPASTQLPDVTFSRVTTCCAVQNIDVVLASGTNKIRFTHPTVHSPAIDKIVISRP
jgi:hypothetical protein